MPYIAIKALPRDEEKKRLLAERINEVMMEVWGCPQRAITISIQDIAPDEMCIRDRYSPAPPAALPQALSWWICRRSP